MLSEITDARPDVKLFVASGASLEVACVGEISSPAGGGAAVLQGEHDAGRSDVAGGGTNTAHILRKKLCGS